jgi:hypothetical protein
MPNVYIEARPRGRPEGSAVQDFVVEDHADHVLAAFKTQREAIEWARKNNHSALVAGISTTKTPITGAPPNPKGTAFLSGRSFGAT